MKVKYLIFFYLLLFYSCENSKKEKVIQNSDSIQKIVIYKNENYSLEYSKSELENIKNSFPSLNEKNPKDPEKTYKSSGIWKKYFDKNGKEQTLTFGSATGQDNFYLLYAYFLKSKNGNKFYEKERENFINLFRTVNEIYQNLNYGGTYFGHQYLRIIGNAEYSVFLVKQQKKQEMSNNFLTEKNQFLNSLRHKIDNHEKYNVYNKIDQKEDIKKYSERKKLFEDKLNYIDQLITNENYLLQTKKFENENYQ